MKLVIIRVIELIRMAVENVDPEFNDWGKLFLQPASSEKFGHYQTNFAMAAAKSFGKPPRVVAESIIAALPENDVIEKLEVAGPGFINVFLNTAFLGRSVRDTAVSKWNFSHINTAGDVVIDYSSPNIAKPMHAGHLRTTIIGDSIKRIMTYMGYHVVADNHLGDWGTQFGKLIVAYRNWLNEDNYKSDPIHELERIYIKFGEEAQNFPELEDMARSEIKKVQDGDPVSMALWKEFVEITLNECKRIYKYLGIEFDTYYGESFYHGMMPEVVKELTDRKIAVESEGALVVFFDEAENLHPCIIRKKDGAYLYSTSDLATVKFKAANYRMNKAIYVTDDRQEAHFKQVFRIAQMAGWNMDFVHVTFGVMSFNGVILSTRAGNTVKLEELFAEAESRAYAVVNEKNPDLPEDEKRNIAKCVGIGALKYSDLSQNRSSNIDFSWEKALSFEGNTAPYLQYTYARIRSIFRKVTENGLFFDRSVRMILETELEKQIAASIVRFPECVEKAAEFYKPNLIADHLFDLAQKFSSFYNSTPILKSEHDILQSRLNLADAVARTMKTGLDLLGIEVVERM